MQALTCWRHPSQRLPSAITKELTSSQVATSERAFFDSLRDAWDAAMRALYYGLRAGRMPYFFCRGSAFTLLWRNGVELERDGFLHCPPVAWQTTDGLDDCTATLCPSTRSLRAQLRAHSVPFKMPAFIGLAGVSEEPPLGVDGEISSALLFSGHESLHSLFEFLLNSSSYA